MENKELYEEQKKSICFAMDLLNSHEMSIEIRGLVLKHINKEMDEVDMVIKLMELVQNDPASWESLNKLKAVVSTLIRSQHRLLQEINEEIERKQGLENFIEGR
tara:strand:- start:1240 stop:1551 length:312 start_codon:yes stop_codon:yes gene_type:complete